MLQKLFLELGLPEVTYRIFQRLLEGGAASARQIAEGLNVPRPTVYDNLNLLIQKGLVTERSEDNKKIFQVDDLKNITQLLETKIKELNSQKSELDELLPELAQNLESVEPKIKFYSGVEGIKLVLRDLLWHENIATITMWPISDTVPLLGKEYMADLNRRRIKQNISIRGMWPRDKAANLVEYPFLGVGEGFLRETRLTPPSMTWSMSYWQYADKVAFISSKKEMFGFVIHSREFADLIKAQFEEIWKVSEPVEPQPELTDEFLKTV